ncbi:hypothetical protein DSL72_006975 [Monilinia vaccinii-corymbosi]|uniref:Uncharacterized protein n=1 Tax=Monilinia vaccinii-corymbosi TaxID=61207 RepID=A0A8A3PLH1_9HELO|nr:hypothetical protein DSL72_006975 [Monilinia vaccinii-corymbosi]
MRSHELGQSSTSGSETRAFLSEFLTQGSSVQWNQETRSSSSTQGSAQRHERHERIDRKYRKRSEGSGSILPSIAEEWLSGEYQGVPESPKAELLPQFEQETPASHGCNQTCHGYSPKAGEPQIGLGIAQGIICFA